MSFDSVPTFADRADAGRRLAAALADLRGEDVVVLGIARGGVPVAAEVARALDAPLDVVVARKIGAPGQPELALGAVAADGTCVLYRALAAGLGLSDSELALRAQRVGVEARRREGELCGARSPAPLAGRVALLVDDGLATGATARAAARSVRARGPRRLVLAVPVGSRATCAELADEVDALVCLEQPEPFFAVGLHYADFAQTSDDDVRRLLAELGTGAPRSPR